MEKKSYIEVNSISSLYDFGIKRIVIAIGIFDGVHIGHQHLLNHLLKMSKKHNATPIALTFYPHPREVLRPDAPHAQLVPQNEKIKLLHQYGVEGTVTIPFTKEFSIMRPKEFIEKILNSHQVRLCGICVGREWRFGANGSGDISLLKDYSEKGHFDFTAVEELLSGSEKVSSTSIRRAIASGSLEFAEKMLGRPYSLFGNVEEGRKIASSVLGHPTANLNINSGIIPPNGLYAGYVVYNNKKYDAAIVIGTSPTFKHQFGEQRRVEVHLLDFSASLYEMNVEIIFKKYIREERVFSSADELKTQIKNDIEIIKAELRNKNSNSG